MSISDRPGRVRGWRLSLSKYIIAAGSKRFGYGYSDEIHDCMSWPAYAILIQTGQDIYAPFRGRYSTKNGAARALVKYGAGDLVSTVQSLLNAIDPLDLMEGDIAIVDLGQGPLGAVCSGSSLLVATEQGLNSVSLDQALHAFRVG